MVIVTMNLDLEQYKTEDCFVLEYDTNLDRVLSKIKKSNEVEIYAKPILLLNRYNKNIDNYYANSVDRVVDMEYIESQEYKKDILITNINSKINLLKNQKTDDTDIAFKILRYIYSRGEKLSPYSSIKNKYGYSYPKIDHMLDINSNKLFEAFDFLVDHRLLDTIFYDKAHFCNECYSGFLNFKEVCPKCNSVDISSEPLIHHFECAYVGLESEFKYENRLICPKCDKELFHIGVDYDKPSFVYRCNKCANEFQDALVQASCFNCGSRYDVDNLIKRDIYEYELTILSENSALFGFQNIFTNILETNLEILSPKIFERYVEIELYRIKRYQKSVSTLVSINLENIKNIYKDANDLQTIKKVFSQIADVIKNFLRSTDIITSFNDIMYGALLVETPLDGAKIATDRLKKEIEELIAFNIHKNYKIGISLKEITQDSTIEELMEFFK